MAEVSTQELDRDELRRLRRENAELMEGAGALVETWNRRVMECEAKFAALRELFAADGREASNGFFVLTTEVEKVRALFEGDLGLELLQELERCRREHARG